MHNRAQQWLWVSAFAGATKRGWAKARSSRRAHNRAAQDGLNPSRNPSSFFRGRAMGFARATNPTDCVKFNTTGKSLLRLSEMVAFVQPCLKKYFQNICCTPRQITSIYHPILPDERGVSRTCRTRGRTRWTWVVPLTTGAACGRQSRGGLTPRRWCLVCGTQFPQARVANKPGTPGRPRRSC